MSILPFPHRDVSHLLHGNPVIRATSDRPISLLTPSGPVDLPSPSFRAVRTIHSPYRAQQRQGSILAIGGAEDRSPHSSILRAFVDAAGGDVARILVVPTASSQTGAGKEHLRAFTRLGVASVDLLDIGSREEANAAETLARLDGASGVFFTGGAQARLSTLLVGTLFVEALRAKCLQGLAVAGTSAGASILCTHMIVNGAGETPPQKGTIELAAGFGLLNQVIIDQHFDARGRFGRLLTAFAANPGLLAFGIDENTALLFTPDGMAKAIGKQSVMVVDGRNIYSDYHDCRDGDMLTVTGAQVHVLAPGRMFDLERRRVLHLVQQQTGRPAG